MSIGFKACADLFISDGSGFLYDKVLIFHEYTRAILFKI